MALPALADLPGLGHISTDWTVPDEGQGETPAPEPGEGSCAPARPEEARLVDLESGGIRTMDRGRNLFSGPSLSDRHVVWSMSRPCDVMPVPDTAHTGAYVGHLENGEVRQLTDYVEPVVFLSGNMAIIIEYCWGGGPTYAVLLD